VFNAFAQRHAERASRSAGREAGEPSSAASASAAGAAGAPPRTPRDDGVGAALQAQLRRVDTARLMHGV